MRNHFRTREGPRQDIAPDSERRRWLVLAVMAFRAIHQKKLVSPWLLLGLIPLVGGLWLTFR